jgi:SAM-dependent methyltransferase
MNFLKKIIVNLAKRVSRKNLKKYLISDLKKLSISNKRVSILEVGSNGQTSDWIRGFKFYKKKSIDIDLTRNPDQVLDICDREFQKKIKYSPDCIVALEVFEHTKNPFQAVENLRKILKKNGVIIVSTPFILGIHDVPYDYFRYTKFGLMNLFRNFENVSIAQRNDGIFDIVFILLMRSFQDRRILNKFLGCSSVIFYYVFFPLFFILNKLFKSDLLTTGYYLTAVKK